MIRHVPVVVIPQDIYAQLNGDAPIQLALDTTGEIKSQDGTLILNRKSRVCLMISS